MAREEPLSPQWWLKRLYKQLQARQDEVEFYDAYYRGEPPNPPWLPEKARREFNRLLKLTKSNYMGLVVDATVERMQIDGFRIGRQAAADMDVWKNWQFNNFDSESDKVILEAVKTGKSYVLVAPNSDDKSQPLMTAEHPSQAIVEYEPGSARRRRAAGLKVWLDDWSGKMIFATLYLPDRIYKFQAKHTAKSLQPRWEPREVRGERWPAKNPLGVVPLVEIANNPQLLTGGMSEIADVIPIQDRIAKTLADRLMTQDFGAFPQKWASGYPEEDDDGNQRPEIDVGRDRMVTSDAPETRFGQWDAAPLDPYSSAKREDVKDIASRTRTPAQYLLGEMSNVNGETLKAAESGLVSKVRQRHRPIGEDFEDVVRLNRLAAGKPIQSAEPVETIWKSPEFRTEGELVDALMKMGSDPLNVPREALWEKWGASQVEIDRWKDQLAEQQADPNFQAILQNANATVAAPPTVTPPNGAPVGG